MLYSDGHRSAATIVGRDLYTDLAVLKAEDGAKGLPVIAIGSSSDLHVGQPVVALGAPLGLSSTVTAGIVSALDRSLSLPADQGKTAHIFGAVQTDASINPGNSGGPLVDCHARLVGVNTAIITVPDSSGQASGGSVGLGFAIPVDQAKPLSDELIAHGNVSRPTLGLQAQTIPQDVADKTGVPGGLYVVDVVRRRPGGHRRAAGRRRHHRDRRPSRHRRRTPRDHHAHPAVGRQGRADVRTRRRRRPPSTSRWPSRPDPRAQLAPEGSPRGE